MKKLCRKLGLAIASLIVALLFVEIALRAFGIAPERYARPTWAAMVNGEWQPTTIWGNGLVKQQSRFAHLGIQMGEYVPGARYRCIYASNPRGYFEEDGGVEMTINQFGMRGGGRIKTVKKPEDTVRVLLLGDSFTFGVGVKDEDTFAVRIEKMLNETSDTVTYEVLNAGVQGYNSRDEVIYLENHWPSFEPDVVLIVFYINDAYDDSAIRNNGEALGIYVDNSTNGLAAVSRIWDLVQHKADVRKASEQVEEFYKQHYFADASAFLENPGDEYVDWTVSKAALIRAGQLAETRGFKLGLVMFPELYRLDSAYPFKEIHSLLNKTCSGLQVPMLDLFDTYEGQDPEALWVHPSDHHPNEIAHEMAGDAMTAFLKGCLSPE